MPAIIVALIAANSINYVTPLRPGPDAGEYSLGALMLKEGRVLYKDIFEQKPPMIYVLNALALSIGDGTFHSIRVLERFLAVAAALLVFFVVLNVFARRSLATLAAIGFSFQAYREEVFEQGNVTEEYAIVFVLAGILCAVRAVLRANKQASPFLILLAGVCFSCAALTKEPFIFSSIPWFFFLVLRPHCGWKPAIRRTLLFALGGVIPLMLFLGYLIVGSALHPWLGMISSSLEYIAESKQHYAGTFEVALKKLGSTTFLATRTGLIASVAGAIAAFACPRFVKRYEYVPLVVVFALATEFFGATRSPRFYGHYFLQVIPSFVLCCACGGALVFYFYDRAFAGRPGDRAPAATRKTGVSGYRVGLLLVLILFLLDSSVIRAYWQRLNQPFVRAEVGRVSKYIKANAEPTDYLWAMPIYNSRFYIETGLTPPPGFHLDPRWNTDRTTADEKQALLNAGGDEGPVWVIVGHNATSLRFRDLLYSLCDTYTRTPFVDQGYGSSAYLYLRNDRAAHLLSPTQLPKDELCIAEYITKSVSYYTSGEFEKSIEICNKVLASEPNSVLAYNNICASYLQLGQFDKAINACEKALAIDPDFARAKGNLAAARAGEASQAR